MARKTFFLDIYYSSIFDECLCKYSLAFIRISGAFFDTGYNNFSDGKLITDFKTLNIFNKYLEYGYIVITTRNTIFVNNLKMLVRHNFSSLIKLCKVIFRLKHVELIIIQFASSIQKHNTLLLDLLKLVWNFIKKVRMLITTAVH